MSQYSRGWRRTITTIDGLRTEFDRIRAEIAAEAAEKKGMDASQISGACSSYSRKYALSGLFAIDDNKDADTDEHANQVKKTPQKRVNKKLVQQYLQQMLECLEAEDAVGLLQLGGEIKDTPEHHAVWQALDSKQKAAIKELIHNLKENDDETADPDSNHPDPDNVATS